MKNKIKNVVQKSPALSVFVFGLVASFIIGLTLAASPKASLEAESASLNGLSVGTDSLASNGSYAQFSSTATSGDTGSGDTSPEDPNPGDTGPGGGEVYSSDYVTEPLAAPGQRSGRFPSRAPNVYQGSILPYLEMAGDYSNNGLGKVVEVPAGWYDAAKIDVRDGGRNGWLNLVAADGEGSVEIRGHMRLHHGRIGIRFIGIDLVGQWEMRAAKDVAWWRSVSQNPKINGSHANSGQPAVWQMMSNSTYGTTRDLTIAGSIGRRTIQDIIKIGSSKNVLIDGFLGHETKWDDYSVSKFHSDGLQTTGSASFKVINSFFANGARQQLGQEFSSPVWAYYANTILQGSGNFEITLDAKGNSPAPRLTFGSNVRISPKASDYDSVDAAWRWASKYGIINNKGGIVSGDYSTAAPPNWRNDSNWRANTLVDSPDKVWREQNPFDSWQSYFQSPRSTFDGAEGGRP